jgi:hypothetical protein
MRLLLKSLGPCIITGAADDDPSGIATYSVAGAQLGTKLLWTALLTWPLMAAVQMMCAWKCLEKPYHCDRDGALLNELNLPVEYIIRITIEAYDKTGHNLDTVLLNAAYAVKQTPLGVL